MVNLRNIPCDRCARWFADDNALQQHRRRVHRIRPGKGRRGRSDEEQPFAELAVEAELKRLSGQSLTDLEESLVS